MGGKGEIEERKGGREGGRDGQDEAQPYILHFCSRETVST